MVVFLFSLGFSNHYLVQLSLIVVFRKIIQNLGSYFSFFLIEDNDNKFKRLSSRKMKQIEFMVFFIGIILFVDQFLISSEGVFIEGLFKLKGGDFSGYYNEKLVLPLSLIFALGTIIRIFNLPSKIVSFLQKEHFCFIKNNYRFLIFYLLTNLIFTLIFLPIKY